jgi:hypothetical protein
MRSCRAARTSIASRDLRSGPLLKHPKFQFELLRCRLSSEGRAGMRRISSTSWRCGGNLQWTAFHPYSGFRAIQKIATIHASP